MNLQTGIHNISELLYHADPCPAPSLSNGIIKVLVKKTPDHAMRMHPRLNPGFEFRTPSDSMDLGQVTHGMLLEGKNKATVVDAKTWQSDAAKDQRAAIRNQGKIPLLRKDQDRALLMLQAAEAFIERSPFADAWKRAKPEQTLIWHQKRIWHRARIDKLDLTNEREPLCFDYKSTASESPDDFLRSNFAGFGYDTQSELYSQGLQELGYSRPRFLFLVQESFEPFRCYWAENDEQRSELACKKITRAQRIWLECLKASHWPGYPASLVYQASPSPWELKQEELSE